MTYLCHDAERQVYLMKEKSLTRVVVLMITFFALTPISLILSIFAMLTMTPTDNPTRKVLGAETVSYNLISAPKSGVQVYASLPNESPTIEFTAGVDDAREEIIRQYLNKYDSPLEPYAREIVNNADEYGLDFRLTTAIAQQESNLCKNIPAESHNCWGWGIHSQGTLGFDGYGLAIENVSRGLRKEYLDKGFITVEDIMQKYTPLSNGSWADGVNKFMAEME